MALICQNRICDISIMKPNNSGILVSVNSVLSVFPLDFSKIVLHVVSTQLLT